MKTLKTFFIALCFLFAKNIFAQNDTTIKIKTPAQCEQCKKRIEHNMSFEKGVKKVNLDIITSELEISYDKRKTSPEKLKTAVTKIGYDADEMPADKKAYEKLPNCCKKEK